MTDAERLAKMWHEAGGTTSWRGQRQHPYAMERAQRLIAQGVTLPPPPDPAEQIADGVGWIVSHVRMALDQGWISPGPACEGVEPQPDPLAQAVLDAEREVIAAAEALVETSTKTTATSYFELRDKVRALREART